jgi:hypothetical protein
MNTQRHGNPQDNLEEGSEAFSDETGKKGSTSWLQATAQLPVGKRKENNRGLDPVERKAHRFRDEVRGSGEEEEAAAAAAAAGGWTDNLPWRVLASDGAGDRNYEVAAALLVIMWGEEKGKQNPRDLDG